MRNYSIVISVIGLCFIIFGAVMSFWITDPLLTKYTSLIHGVLLAVAVILLAKGIPSEADEVTEKNNYFNDLDSIYKRISGAEERLNDQIDNLDRMYEQEITSIHKRCDENETSKKK